MCLLTALLIRQLQLGGTTTRFGYPNSGPRSFPALRALLHGKFIIRLYVYRADSLQLDVAAGTMQDKNSEEYLHTIEEHYERVVAAIKDRLSASRRSSSCTKDLR